MCVFGGVFIGRRSLFTDNKLCATGSTPRVPFLGRRCPRPCFHARPLHIHNFTSVRRGILPLATRLLVYSNQLRHLGSKLEKIIGRNPHLYHYSISFYPILLAFTMMLFASCFSIIFTFARIPIILICSAKSKIWFPYRTTTLLPFSKICTQCNILNLWWNFMLVFPL